MIQSMHNNLSALNALGTKAAVSANNIANVNTDGFKKSEAVLQEVENGGVRVSISGPAAQAKPGAIEEPGALRQTGAPQPPTEAAEANRPPEPEMSDVDLARELPKTIPTRLAYDANIKAIQAQDEMVGSMLDTLG